jgi:hypothetical protein
MLFASNSLMLQAFQPPQLREWTCVRVMDFTSSYELYKLNCEKNKVSPIAFLSCIDKGIFEALKILHPEKSLATLSDTELASLLLDKFKITEAAQAYQVLKNVPNVSSLDMDALLKFLSSWNRAFALCSDAKAFDGTSGLRTKIVSAIFLSHLPSCLSDAIRQCDGYENVAICQKLMLKAAEDIRMFSDRYHVSVKWDEIASVVPAVEGEMESASASKCVSGMAPLAESASVKPASMSEVSYRQPCPYCSKSNHAPERCFVKFPHLREERRQLRARNPDGSVNSASRPIEINNAIKNASSG